MAETRDWAAELRERVLRYVHTAVYGDNDGSNALRAVERIMADVEVFGVLKAREGFAHGWNVRGGRDGLGESGALLAYPLPARTFRTLREEPDPHGLPVLYSFNDREGIIMGRGKSEDEGAQYPLVDVIGPGGFLLPSSKRIDLWASLKAEPYVTKEVPADEDNPWPEVEP